MTLRRRLREARLYVVLDAEVADYARLRSVLRRALACGVTLFQLRDKPGIDRKRLEFCRRAIREVGDRAVFIVNDRVDLVLASGAHGVHLGREDLPLKEARRILGPRRLIGASCQTLGHLRQAQIEGADYVGFGSVFATETKPLRTPMPLGRLRAAARASRIPLFAIGGISSENVGRVLACGVGHVAVTRALLRARRVSEVVENFRGAFLKFGYNF